MLLKVADIDRSRHFYKDCSLHAAQRQAAGRRAPFVPFLRAGADQRGVRSRRRSTTSRSRRKTAAIARGSSRPTFKFDATCTMALRPDDLCLRPDGNIIELFDEHARWGENCAKVRALAWRFICALSFIGPSQRVNIRGVPVSRQSALTSQARAPVESRSEATPGHRSPVRATRPHADDRQERAPQRTSGTA